MHRTSLVATLLFAGACLASDAPPVTIPDTEQWDVRSNDGLDYRVFVSGPAGKAPPGGWPVIYLTDGNVNFLILHAAVRRLGPAVVVGVGYPEKETTTHHERRAFDLTSAQSDAVRKRFPPGGLVKKTGGNDRFLAFLEDEVKPRVERRFPIDKTRQALFGHSLGGSFALHVLFTKPAAFQTYVASSPSLWWNDNDIRKEEDAFVSKHAAGVQARLLVTVGGWEEQPGPGVAPEVAAVLRDHKMVTRAKEMVDRLKTVKGLTVAYREFAEEDHASVLLPAAGRGVRFALDRP